MTAPALSSLADALGGLAASADSHAALLLGLASLDADEAAKAIEAGAVAPSLVLALREDATRLERDGERLGLALGPGLAVLIKTTIKHV